MTTRLIIARHGNTFGPYDIVRQVGGKTDIPLVASGIEQAQKIGTYLHAHNITPDKVFAGHLKRTTQTAEYIIESAQIKREMVCLTQFNELDYGVDENKAESDVIARIGEKARADWNDKAIVPDGWNVNVEAIIESWIKFGSEITSKYKNKTILVVTSNGIARFAPHLTGDFEGFATKNKIKIATGAFCLLSHGAEQNWKVEAWNIRP